jgi:hypothetical protein
MAHFAEIGIDNIVTRVIVVDNKYVPSDKDIAGELWCKNKFGGNWKQTSYSGSFRKQFAGAGHIYDSTKDIFIVPQPFASWALDSSNDWQPPIALPSDASLDKQYEWDEDVYQADNSKGWVVVE